MSDPTQETPQETQAPAVRPESVPEQFWDVEKGELKLDDFTSSYSDLAQQAQVSADLMASIPESADGYEIGLPDEFEAPEGFEFFIDGDDRVGEIQAWAHANKVQPEAVKALMAIYAKDQLAAFETMQGEMASLGSNAKGRIADLTIALNARLQPNEAQAIAGSLGSADAVRALEKLLTGRNPAAAPAPHQQSAPEDDLMAITDPFKRVRAIQAQKGKAK